jgi:transcriptional regulator GlxA family with amidase domain
VRDIAGLRASPLTAVWALPAWPSLVVILHAASRLQLLAGHAGQHRDPGRAAAVELAARGARAGRDLTLADIAAQAGTSTRTLMRRFREQAGTTPLQWLHRARVRQAQHLLETTQHSVERIGAQVGFGSPTAFRDRFKRTTGVSPHTYRRTFS